MSTRRAVFQSNASSPLLVSVAGHDAATAQLDDCIFNGAQDPLRLWQATHATVPWIDFTNTANIFANVGPPVLPSPAGKTPIFVVICRQGGLLGSRNTVPFRNNAGGAAQTGLGGSISNVDGGGNRVVGINMCRNNSVNGLYVGDAVINFLVFRNIQ